MEQLKGKQNKPKCQWGPKRCHTFRPTQKKTKPRVRDEQERGYETCEHENGTMRIPVSCQKWEFKLRHFLHLRPRMSGA